MKFLVDENVSLAVARRLRLLGHEVEAVAESGLSATSDQRIFEKAVDGECIFITRDQDFTNYILFPPQRAKGIIYIRKGNLRADEEAALVERIVTNYPLEKIEGKLLTIYKNFISIR